jgi:hypothetical protein
MGILLRAAPEIDLTVDELAAAGLASRTTTERLPALDNSGQPGAGAELALPAVPPPGAPSGFPSADTGDTIVTTVTWQDGTPPPTRGWLVEWDGGSKTVPSAEFNRADAGWNAGNRYRCAPRDARCRRVCRGYPPRRDSGSHPPCRSLIWRIRSSAPCRI